MQWKWKACYVKVSFELEQIKRSLDAYVANTPCDSTLLTRCRSLVGLTFDACKALVNLLSWKSPIIHTKIHDVVSADSTVVDDNIPGP